MGRRILILSVAALVAVAALLAVSGSSRAGGRLARAASSPARLVAVRTADAAAPSTTIAPLGKSLPVSPVTLPLTTTQTNAHVDPVFAILSGVGFGVALLMMAARMFVTRRGGADRRPFPIDPAADSTLAAPDHSPASRSS